MPEVTTGSRDYKQSWEQADKFLSYHVHSSFIILNYGFSYLLNFAFIIFEFMCLLF